MGVPNDRSRTRRGPTREQIAAAKELLDQGATGATSVVSIPRFGTKQGRGGSTAFGSRGDVSSDAILEAAALPDPSFAARQAAARAKKEAMSSEPTDQVMSKLIGNALSDFYTSGNKKLDDNDKMIEKSQASIQRGRVARGMGQSGGNAVSDFYNSGNDKLAENDKMIEKSQASIQRGRVERGMGQSNSNALVDAYNSGNKKLADNDKMIEKSQASIQSGRVASGRGQSDAAPAPATATLSDDRIQSLFKKATGTSFDPKSRADIARKAELAALISGRPDLADASDTKIALAWYKSKKK
jgi:hypothetical protein